MDEYEDGRVGYAPDAVERVVDEFSIRPGTRLLDLGAGLGTLTRLLVQFGADITAVEPLPGLRRRLAERLPSVRVLDGRAEAIPVADRSMDVVMVGAAFHWFVADLALGEITRVLTGGGGLALLWNPEAEGQGAWQDEVEAVLQPYDTGITGVSTRDWCSLIGETGMFRNVAEEWFAWQVATSADDYAARFASISFIAALPDHARQAVVSEVRRILTSGPLAQGRETFPITYRTRLIWARSRHNPSSPCSVEAVCG